MVVLVYLFYILGVFFLLQEFHALDNPKGVLKLINSVLEKRKNKQDLSKSEKNLALSNLLYVLWGFFGLFSSQWFLFAILFILSMMPKKKPWILRIDALLSILIILSIIINKFHLHLDLPKIIINIF